MNRVGQRLVTIAAAIGAAAVAPGAMAQTDIPEAVAKLIRADKECRDYDTDFLKKARETAPLTENHTLYLLPCFAGAYNVVYRVYVLDKRYPNEVRPSFFAGYSDEMGWFGQQQLINASYDAKTKTLTAFEKGRGLGDCGSIPTYQWNEYDWRMLEYRHWGPCDGSHMPDKWPVIYRYKEPQKGK